MQPTDPVAKYPVVPAAYAEPKEPGNKFAAAQPQLHPHPRPVEPKPGSEPPAAPRALPPLLGAAPSIGGPLVLDEVLFSVERNYPLLRAIEQERGAARTVHSLGRERAVDLFELRQRYAFLAPLLDAEYGSATFMAVTRPAELELRVSATGLLMRDAIAGSRTKE